MFQKDWEKRWEKYGKELASSIHETVSKDEQWLSHFLQSSVLLTNMLVPSIAAFVLEFPMKLGTIEEKTWTKKLNKAKKADVQKTIKIFLMDYFSSFFEHPVHALLLESHKMAQSELEKKVQQALCFTKEETKLYAEIIQKKETYFPTIVLLQHMHTGKDANNQALVEGVEMFKEEAFNRMDKNFQTFFQEKKD